ncbi:hypothetical protein PAG55_25775, partial [Klebsiella pneumoniae]
YYWYMSGKICERVSDYRTAAFFEIGRLLTLWFLQNIST